MSTVAVQNSNSKNKVKLLAVSGLFAALIYVVTAFIHVPTGLGYIHPGDGFIYLAASLLPAPYAIAASAIGGALADGLSGYYIWVPATLIIKAVTAAFFSSKTEKIICKRNILAIIPSYLLCVIGYSLYQGTVITLANKEAVTAAVIFSAFETVPLNSIQIVLSTALFVILGIALDKMNFKKKLL